ncbi:hypothetical protein I4U23_030414 [Adineta vaga]|nr:hypothetical protein I4U23_030414 [Adineta vaga]
MSREQYTTNLSSESRMNTTNDLSNSSGAARVPYRSISAKRPRDPSNRKSVSFNDVPIIYEVPSHDAMRSSNCDAYRSWLYTDPTSPTAAIPSLYSTQTLSPLNSTSITAQKLHANRLSSALYATSSTLITPNRMPDWALRVKTQKTTSSTEETNSTNENNQLSNTNVPVLQTTLDENLNKENAVKNNNQSTYNHTAMIHSSQSTSTTLTSSSSAVTSETNEEKKYSYRTTPLIPETEHIRGFSLTNGSLTNSSPTYTSNLSSNLSQSTNSTNEALTYPNSRILRARSAITPSTTIQSSIRTNDPISISPFRATAAAFSTSTPTPAARAILRPSTVAFQCTQPGTTMSNINPTNNSSTVPSTTATHTTKPPTIAPRFHPSAAATAAAHSRFILPQNRTLTSAALSAAAMKYTIAHPTIESTFANNMISQSTISKPPPTAYSRSRSANVLNIRRTPAPVGMMDGHSHGNTATSSIDPTNNLYSTTRRSPNVRQNYGSYLLNRVLLPTTTN